MATVFTQVCSNAVRAGFLCDMRRAHRIRMRAAARIPDRRNVVNIDAQADVVRRHFFRPRLPGLIASVPASSGGRSSGA
mgnify:CR=1 FL=1